MQGTQFDPQLIDVVVASAAVRRLIGGASAPADLAERPQQIQASKLAHRGDLEAKCLIASEV